MKIGIVGSGIAGLAAAWFLRRSPGFDCEVTVFEHQAQIGMDAHSIPLRLPAVKSSGSNSGHEVRGDVPSRMFNSLLWPRLFQMYQELGVEFESVDASQSFCRGRDNYLNLDVANRPQQFAAMMLSGRSRRLLKEAQRFKRMGQEDLDRGCLLYTSPSPRDLSTSRMPSSA